MNLPIAERELLVAARSPKTAWSRFFGSLVFLFITFWFFWATQQVSLAGSAAANTHQFITYLALLTCMFSTCVIADAISSEKRNGTLGLLFLTDLKGFDVILGKLVAHGLVGFYGLLSILPIISIPVLMGGVSGEAQFRTSITLLNTLFLGQCIGLWVSVGSLEQKKATNRASGCALLLLWGLPALAYGLRYRGYSVELAHALELLSPSYQIQQGGVFGIGMLRDDFWLSIGITHALAWLAFWRACQRAPKVWQDRPITKPERGWKRFFHELRFGSPEVRLAFRRRLLNLNAIHWLSAREKIAPAGAWMFLGLVICGWSAIWLWIKYATSITGNRPPPIWALGIPSVLLMFLGLWMRTSSLAAEVVARDRFTGALELILSTSISIDEFVRGHWLTFRRVIVAPAIAACVIGAIVFACALATLKFEQRQAAAMRFEQQQATPAKFQQQAPPSSPNNIPTAWRVYLGLNSLFIMELFAAIWTGLWSACVSRTQATAQGGTFLRLFAMPWAIFFVLLSLAIRFRVAQNAEFPDVFSLWWLLFMVNAFGWTIHSRAQFCARLRVAASDRFQPPRPNWRRLFGLSKKQLQPAEIRLSHGGI